MNKFLSLRRGLGKVFKHKLLHFFPVLVLTALLLGSYAVLSISSNVCLDVLEVKPDSIYASIGDVVTIDVKLRFAHPQPCPAYRGWYFSIEAKGALILDKKVYRHDDVEIIGSSEARFKFKIKVLGSGYVIVKYHYSNLCPFCTGRVETVRIPIKVKTKTLIATTTTTSSPRTTSPTLTSTMAETTITPTSSVTTKVTRTLTTKTTPIVKVRRGIGAIALIYASRAPTYYYLLIIVLIVIPGVIVYLKASRFKVLRGFREKLSSILSSGSLSEAKVKDLIMASIARESRTIRHLTLFLSVIRYIVLVLIIVIFVVVPIILVGTLCPCPLWVAQVVPIISAYARTLAGVTLAILIVAIVSSVIIKRSWCGWLCPLGFIQELLAKVYGRSRISGRVDYYLRFLKYVFLALLVIIVVTSSNNWLCRNCFIVALTSHVRYLTPLGTYLSVLLLLLAILIIVLCILIPRFFCRYLCPAGAFFEGISTLAPIGVVKSERCKNCDVCIVRSVCPLGLEEPGATECTSCLECVKACPFKAIDLDIRFKSKR